MADLPTTAKLQDIVLPASHDSGMSMHALGAETVANPLAWLASGLSSVASNLDNLAHARRPRLHNDNFVTQKFSVYGQLVRGARQFDVRLTKTKDGYRCYHGAGGLKIIGMRRYGERWNEIAVGVAAFMAQTGGSEVVVLKMDKQKGKQWDILALLSQALDASGYKYNGSPLSLKWVDQETMANLAGRILVCVKPDTLAEWSKVAMLHKSITLCLWQKNKKGLAPKDAKPSDKLGNKDVPIYLLLGDANAGLKWYGLKHNDRDNVLDKQVRMKAKFFKIKPRGVGLRGIWFNTYSVNRDIETYCKEIWHDKNQTRRDLNWLPWPYRQNVASLDFVDDEKVAEVLSKNQLLPIGVK